MATDHKDSAIVGFTTQDETPSQGKQFCCSRVDTYMLKLRNKLYETIEELKMKRISCIENESKIKQLLSENHRIDNKYEEACSSRQQLQDNRKKDIDQSRKEYEKLIKQLSEEKENCCLASELREKEVKTLKETVQNQQLEKYDLESQLRQFKERAAMEASCKDSYYKKVEELEEKCRTLQKQCEELDSFSQEIKADAQEAVKCNQKLLLVNHHLNNCVLKWKQEEIDALKHGQLDSMTNNEQVTDYRQSILDKVQTIAMLKSKVSEQDAMIESITKIMQQEKQKKMAALKSLEDMNLLWARNTEIGCRKTCDHTNVKHEVKEVEQVKPRVHDSQVFELRPLIVEGTLQSATEVDMKPNTLLDDKGSSQIPLQDDEGACQKMCVTSTNSSPVKESLTT